MPCGHCICEVSLYFAMCGKSSVWVVESSTADGPMVTTYLACGATRSLLIKQGELNVKMSGLFNAVMWYTRGNSRLHHWCLIWSHTVLQLKQVSLPGLFEEPRHRGHVLPLLPQSRHSAEALQQLMYLFGFLMFLLSLLIYGVLPLGDLCL